MMNQHHLLCTVFNLFLVVRHHLNNTWFMVGETFLKAFVSHYYLGSRVKNSGKDRILAVNSSKRLEQFSVYGHRTLNGLAARKMNLLLIIPSCCMIENAAEKTRSQ